MVVLDFVVECSCNRVSAAAVSAVALFPQVSAVSLFLPSNSFTQK